MGPSRVCTTSIDTWRGGLDADPNALPEFSKLVALQDRAWLPPVFTHGDLSSLNILVRGDVIVGIIDWEMVSIVLGVYHGFISKPDELVLARGY
jgi:aminoglycoside phosphotransferase (APT) family kinase protein